MSVTRRQTSISEPRFAPSILNADFGRLAEAVGALERGGADWVHVDVMDGHFVPNLTFGPKMVADLHKATRLPLDVHLMIERPDDWVDRYVDAGAAYVVIHVEAAQAVSATLSRIRARGAKAGITLNPDTPVDRVLPFLDEVDLALVMSVNPGFGGQKFIESAIGKLQRLRKEIDTRHLAVELEVDGGVKLDNVRRVIEAGASVVVAGSAVFESAGRRRGGNAEVPGRAESAPALSPGDLQRATRPELDLTPALTEGAVRDTVESDPERVAPKALREIGHRESDALVVREGLGREIDVAPLWEPRRVEDQIRHVEEEVAVLRAAPVQNGADAVTVDEHVAVDEVVVEEMPHFRTRFGKLHQTFVALFECTTLGRRITQKLPPSRRAARRRLVRKSEQPLAPAR